MNPPSTASTPAAVSPLQRLLQGNRKEGTEGWTPADIWVSKRGDHRAFKLTLTALGFFLFTFVILTFRVDAGDVGVAIALLGILVQRGKTVAPPFVLILSLFVGWCALGLLTTEYPFIVERETLLLAKLLLIWFAALNALRTRSQFRVFLIFCVFLYATHPVRGAVWNSLIYGHSQYGRFIWLNAFGNANGMAAITILYLSMAAALLVSERDGIVKMGAQASVLVFSVIIFLTQSRGGLLALMTFAGLVVFHEKKRARLLVMGAVIAAGGAFFVPDTGWQRLGQLTSLVSEGTAVLEDLDDKGSARERYEILRVASRVISENPVTGVGWGAYPRAHFLMVRTNRSEYSWFRLDRVAPMDAHNTYATVLAETGWVGFILYFSAIGLALRRVSRIRRKWKRAAPRAVHQVAMLQWGFIAFMVAAIFASLSHYAYFYIHLTVMWVGAEVLDQDMKALKKAASQTSAPAPPPAAAATPGAFPAPAPGG